MKFIDNKLYIEFPEMVEAGLSANYLRKARSVKTTCWSFIDDPLDKRRVLIEFEALKPKYKALITEKFGNPYAFAGQKHLKTLIPTDQISLETLLKYRLNDGKSLPKEHVNRYSEACNYLNFLGNTPKKAAKTLGFNGQDGLYGAVIGLIRSENIDLPTNYSRLREAVRQFKAQGATSVINAAFGNSNAVKVTDEAAQALLNKLLEHPNKFTDWQVARKYNKWARQEGRKTITHATVGNYRRDAQLEIGIYRDGSQEWRNTNDKVVRRKTTSAPLLLINSDDNNLDLYFVTQKQDKKGNWITDYYNRVVLYVVMDTYNNYPLGYAIGKTVTKELVRAAYLDAIHHIQELTGDYHIWHQIQADRWGLQSAELRTFYEQQAKFTPAAFTNARSKKIEQYFGWMWHNGLREVSATTMNYAGHNITAERKTNREAIEQHKKDFPTIEQAPTQIAAFIHYLRTHADERNPVSKQQQWLNAWAEMPQERKRQLSDEARFLFFGFRHNHTNKITNRGLEFTLNNRRFAYDVAEEDYIRMIGSTGQVIYDPLDMERVMFENKSGNYRMICSMNKPIPMALADFEEGDRERLNALLAEKKRISQRIINAREQREKILVEHGINVNELHDIDTESILQAGVITKAEKLQAENNYKRIGKAQEDDDDDAPIDVLSRF